MCIYGLSLNAYYVQYNAQTIAIKDENIESTSVWRLMYFLGMS